MRTLTRETSYNAPRGRLLGGWRDILDDIRLLCLDLNALPDRCACGGGLGLDGSCACCRNAGRGRLPDCPDCAAALARLRPQMDALTVDTIRFFPAVAVLAGTAKPNPVVAESAAFERHIAGVVRTFVHLVLAADEFHGRCRTSFMPVLRDAARSLPDEARELDTCLRREK